MLNELAAGVLTLGDSQMERSLWNRIQELYHQALSVSPSERSAFLASACKDDLLLLREVNLLLKADASAAGFLELPVFELGLRVISSPHDRANGNGSAPAEDLVGTTIDGRYLVEQHLDHGGMGRVYLARDAALHDRPVVIKVLLETSLENPYVVTKFRHEAEALSRINHPNIVHVLGAGKPADSKPYIVMEYVEGVTLRSQMSAEGMHLERAAAILKQLGAALDYVHERGILHRDLKPENILLQSFPGGTELVKIVDFGIAHVQDSDVAPSSANNAPIGTYLYMSPEQLRGGEVLTPASDIFALAIVAYEMVTGRRPFNPASAPQLLELHRDGVRPNPLDLRPGLKTETRAILLRALSFDPAVRYESAAEFCNRLARALTGGAENSRAKRNPAAGSRFLGELKLGIAGLLILLSATAAIYFYNREHPVTQKQTEVTDPTPAPTPSSPARSFNYWLTVQKMRNGRPYQKEFVASGKEIFETGDKFRLNVSSPEPGYLYLFNEGPPSQTGTSFTMLFPTPLTNRGSATLGANQLVQTGWNRFTGQGGAENFWIVWSAAPIRELDAAEAEAFRDANGGLSGDTLVAVKKYLVEKSNAVKTKYTTKKETHQIAIHGNGDVLVRMVELRHQ